MKREHGIHDDSEAEARTLFSRYIEERRLRKTPERYAIMEKALAMRGHFSSDMLHAGLESSGYHVSRSTVYSTLELLCECGLLRQELLTVKKAYYEVSRANHCHLLCTQCHKVRELRAEEVTQTLRSMATGGFRASYVSMTVYGLCEECARRQSGEIPAPADIGENKQQK